MARISGVDLPRNKRIEIALTYIYGLGRSTARNIAFGSGSMTVAITSMASSFEFPESFFFLSSS